MIVDASVALKWLITEPDTEAALAVLKLPGLMAPDFLVLELSNTLARTHRQGRLSDLEAVKAWARIENLPVALVDWEPLRQRGFALSLELNVAFYDCLYLALALEEDDVVVTADARFVRVVQSRPALHGRAVLLSDL